MQHHNHNFDRKPPPTQASEGREIIVTANSGIQVYYLEWEFQSSSENTPCRQKIKSLLLPLTESPEVWAMSVSLAIITKMVNLLLLKIAGVSIGLIGLFKTFANLKKNETITWKFGLGCRLCVLSRRIVDGVGNCIISSHIMLLFLPLSSALLRLCGCLSRSSKDN